MKNTDLRSSWSNPALATGTDDQEKMLHHPKDDTESYITAKSELFNIDKLAGASNQPSTVQEDRGVTEFRDSFSSEDEL